MDTTGIEPAISGGKTENLNHQRALGKFYQFLTYENSIING
jgi:hypothetical protein